jgi:hypothetical protein
MELQLLRQKVDLDNEQLRAAKVAELRDTMGRKGRLSRVSMLGGGGDTGDGDLSEDLETRYLQILYKQVIPTLSDGEAVALKALAKQYMLNKQKIGALIEDNVALD